MLETLALYNILTFDEHQKTKIPNQGTILNLENLYPHSKKWSIETAVM